MSTREVIRMIQVNAVLLLFACIATDLIQAAPQNEDCDLHAPNTMHEFCCEIHDENMEFMDCEIDWNNKIHATTEQDELSLIFCISECVYNKTDYLGGDRKSLRMKAIKYHLQEIHADVEAEELMYKTFEMCGTHAQGMLAHKEVQELGQRLAKHSCHPYPGLVFECVSNALILNCPPKKFHGSASCDYARDYLRTCLKKR